jgi:hypothetical protein
MVSLLRGSRHHTFHDDPPAFVRVPQIWLAGHRIIFFSRPKGNKVYSRLLRQIGKMAVREKGDRMTTRAKLPA